MSFIRLAALIVIAAAVPLFAAESELVLVPLWYYGGGAYESNWTTHLSVYNRGGNYVEPQDNFELPCQWLIDPCPRGFWAERMLVYQASETVAGGFLMRVPNPDDMQFSLRVFEESARDEDLGTDVPVVREHDLRAEPVQIMNIPWSNSRPDAFRYTVRAYAVGDAPVAHARINGYLAMGDGSPDLIVTKDVMLQRIPRGLGHYYTEDNEVISQLIQIAAGMGQLRIEIEPMSPGLKWWGMVSVTNNRSQDVTVVTPR
jgi:hypothetical protein